MRAGLSDFNLTKTSDFVKENLYKILIFVKIIKLFKFLKIKPKTMFAKNVPMGGISNKDAETIIGASVKVEGNFVCEGDMIVDGEVKGKIETNGFLQVGPKSVINADVKAGNGKVSGEIKGNVIVKGYLELTSSARIYGDLEAQSLSMERGALINGRCLMAGADTMEMVDNAEEMESAESQKA